MPFRCRCGRTFEKTDTFATHTSSCAPFHRRRMSDTSFQSVNTPQQPQSRHSSLPFINTSSIAESFTNFLSSPTKETPPDNLSTSMPSLFMPTALSIQSAFERRRSMSYNDEKK
ncbi:hypothetical protein CU097_010414 [Rhizopus azygosporus]|uniref:Uncharacterized protein n=1 Tax=Rhizopus azygosporus TaxID=86630 RepID=A0A367JJJ2_RHIAZ|nr:hypothetical protein CU097_010414 [Rhizopus azygosporus]